MVVLAGGIAYLINGPLLDAIISRNAVKIILLHHAIMPTVLLRVCLTAVLLCGLMAAVIFARAKNFSIQSAACILIGVLVLVETLTYAHFKVNGPQTWTYPVPFRMFNYFNVPPSVMQPPGDTKLTEFHQSFDIDNSRIAVFSDDCAFPGTKIPHVAEFWNARTIGGYGTGVSKRLAMLPWPKGVQTLRTIDFTSTRDLDASAFSLLAFLNVRYFLVLTPDVYFNVATRDLPAQCDKQDFAIGDKIYPLLKRDIAGISFRYLENPVKPLPRHFLVGQVSGSQEPPIPLSTLPISPTNSGIRLFERQTNDLTHTSFAERCFDGTRQFDASGDLSVSYRGDVIDVRVTPSAQERFLVLSESYNPQWRVYAGDRRTETIPTNLVMNGVLIPAGLDRVSLRFEPFSSQRWAPILMLIALFGFLILTVTLWRAQRPLEARVMRDLAPCCICGTSERELRFVATTQPCPGLPSSGPYGGHYQINVCKGCGLNYSSPIFDERDVQALYTGYSEANVADDEIANVRATMKGYYELGRPFLSQRKRALDIGCDIGLLLEVMRGRRFRRTAWARTGRCRSRTGSFAGA